jgi:hypothetical protein
MILTRLLMQPAPLITGVFALVLLQASPANSKVFYGLCSIYTEYLDCNVTTSQSSISANFPTGYHIFTRENTVEVKLYDARRREPFYALGIATTIILGPLGLLGFLVTKNVVDIDYGFTFKDQDREKTGFIRFKNNRVSLDFAESIKPFLLSLSSANPASSSKSIAQ